jgi:hypothetical protein
MKLLTYEDYYEFGCKYDKPVAETDNLKITTGLNIDGSLNYVKIYRKGEKDKKLCRLILDKCFCQYWVSDFSLHDKEIDEIKPILKKKRKDIINIINEAKIKENLKPLIRLRTKLFMPNYNKIKGEEIYDISYLDIYEFEGDLNDLIGFSDNFDIYTAINVNLDLNYISIYKKGSSYKYGCRLFIDKPEYFISDFRLNDKEIDEISEFMKVNWNKSIDLANEERKMEDIPLLDKNMQIPDYNILKGDN